MRYTFLAAAVGLTVGITLSSTVFAQDRPASPAGPVALAMPGLPALRSLVFTLRRSDVQSSIGLDLKEKQALADVLDPAKRQPITFRLTSNDPDPEAARKKMQDQVAAMQTDTNSRIKAALRPEQFARLTEIDLQWRGLLSLEDSKVSERLGVEPSQRAEIAKISAEYQRTKQEVMFELAEKDQQDTLQGTRRMVRMQMNPKELENPLSPAYKKLSAAKKQAEEKIMGLLTADERANWERALGAPFSFRTDIPGNRF